MSDTPVFLISESETAEDRAARRAASGRSNGETFAGLLRKLVPSAACELVQTAEAGPGSHPSRALSEYDAVVLAGSPMHLYAETPEVRRQVAFMRAVYASGTPSFGSCAGLQIAVVAAGGAVRPSERAREAAFARRIMPTEAGRAHGLMRGRPPVFDAPAIHSDEVATLPTEAELLATSRTTEVQAAVIAHAGGTFWGVQYHPELPLSEIADGLCRQGSDLVGAGFAQSESDVESYAAMVTALDTNPERHDLAWRLGLDEQVTDAARRQSEIRNFIDLLVQPTRSKRGRA